MASEKEYIIRISNGDTKAFDIIFMLYYPKVKSFILGLIKDEENARDLAQDIFLKVWVNRGKIAEIEYFKSYLFQMSKNVVYDYFSKQQKVSDHVPIWKIDPTDTSLIDEKIEAEDLELLVNLLIQNMPEQRRKVYVMSRREGLKNDEISEKLNISKRTVETHISNALKDIRKLISSVILFLA